MFDKILTVLMALFFTVGFGGGMYLVALHFMGR